MTWRSLIQNRIFLYFLIFPFFVPYSLKFIPGLTKVYSIILILRLLAVLMIFGIYFIRHRVSRAMLMIISMNLIIFISSVMHGLKESGFYTELLPALALPILMEIGTDAGIKKVLQVLYSILSTLVTINFFLTLLYPKGLDFASLYISNGLNPLYFLGIDNGVIYILITFLALNYLLYDESSFNIKLILSRTGNGIIINPVILCFDIISIVTMMFIGSATGLMVLMIFIIFVKMNKIISKKNYMYILLGTYVSFFVFVILLGSSFPLVAGVANLLGRDIGFTGRSLLWEKALEIIRQNPVIGLGNNPEVINIWGSFFSAHNQLLDIAIRGGLIALILFVLLHTVAIKNLAKEESRRANILFVTIFCFMIGGLMESGVRPMHYMFLVLAYYVNYMDFK